MVSWYCLFRLVNDARVGHSLWWVAPLGIIQVLCLFGNAETFNRSLGVYHQSEQNHSWLVSMLQNGDGLIMVTHACSPAPPVTLVGTEALETLKRCPRCGERPDKPLALPMVSPRHITPSIMDDLRELNKQ